MKLAIFTSLIFFLFVSGQVQAQVAAYSFDGGTSNDDVSINHGTAVNTTPTSDRFGNPNHAMAFNGMNSYISVPDNNALDFANTDFSISLWFKTGSSNIMTLVNKGQGMTSIPRFFLRMESADIKARLSQNNNNRNFGANGSYADNQWHHVTLTRSNGTAKLYVDGVLEQTDVSINIDITNSRNWFFGAQDGTTSTSVPTGNYFNGSMDDIQLFNTALDSTGVMSLFTAADPSLGHDLTVGRVAKYSFNGGNANDDWGTNNGTVQGATLTMDRFGNNNKAYSFDGTDDYIVVAANSDMQFGTGDFTISCWFQTSVNHRGVLINSGEGTTLSPRIFARLESNNSIAVRVGQSTTRVVNLSTPNTYLSTTQWHQLTIVKESNEIRLLIDGRNVAIGDDGVVNSNNNRSWFFGAQDGTTSTSIPAGNYFDGAIDDICFYDRALTNSELAALYTVVNPVLSTTTLLPISQLTVYPNPVLDQLYLDLEDNQASAWVQIMNTKGQLVHQQNITTTAPMIKVDALSSGVYFLHVQMADQTTAITKFIKQ